MKKERLFEGAYIELRGNSDLLIEGNKGILEYEEDKILLQLTDQKLQVVGKKLTLRFLSDERVAVSGYIRGISYV